MAIRRIKVEGVSRDIYDARIDAIDSSLSTSSVNPVQNSAIGTEFGKVAYMGEVEGSAEIADFDAATDTVWNKAQTLSSAQKAQARANIGVNIVTTLSSASTDDEIPSAKCIYDNLGSGGGGGITGVGVTAIVAISESDYAALATKDPTTLYIVTPDAV